MFIHRVSAVARWRVGSLEVLVQAEHACGSCPVSPVSSRLHRGCGLSPRRGDEQIASLTAGPGTALVALKGEREQ
jgi:hypothetical protein